MILPVDKRSSTVYTSTSELYIWICCNPLFQVYSCLKQPVDENCELIGFSPTANAIVYCSYYSDMYGTVRKSLEDWYNPSIQSAVIVLMGSSFCLFLFLNSPDFTNPYYVFGVGVMCFTIVFAALMLISVLLKRR